MAVLTVDMLRKRAEHNQGMLSSLEELSLHQLQLTDVSILASLCKRLKILYLQANHLDSVAVLGKLKALEYLNIAMNRVSSLHGLHRCESLCKLDLTLNQLTDAQSLVDATEVLQHTQALRELFLMGNACQQHFPSWRLLVVGRLPQLRRLEAASAPRALPSDVPVVDDDASAASTSAAPLPQPPASSGAACNEQPLRQKNEAKLQYWLLEEPSAAVLRVQLGKHIDTAQVDVDVQPSSVTVTVQGRVLRLLLPCEVVCSGASAQRSKTTGELVVRMPRCDCVLRPHKPKQRKPPGCDVEWVVLQQDG